MLRVVQQQQQQKKQMSDILGMNAAAKLTRMEFIERFQGLVNLSIADLDRAFDEINVLKEESITVDSIISMLSVVAPRFSPVLTKRVDAVMVEHDERVAAVSGKNAESLKLSLRALSSSSRDSVPQWRISTEHIDRQLTDRALVESDCAESITSTHHVAHEWEQPNLHFEMGDTALPSPQLPVPDARDVPPALSWDRSRVKRATQESAVLDQHTSKLSECSTASASFESTGGNLNALLSNLVQATGRLADELGDMRDDCTPQMQQPASRAVGEPQHELQLELKSQCTGYMAETEDGRGHADLCNDNFHSFSDQA